MRPDERALDDEIRGHLALSVKDRIERGEDPEAARLAALRELGYVPAIRDAMRRVWHRRWIDEAEALGREMRIGVRSLRRAKGLGATVVLTLALGIGANAAIFSVVRQVLFRPLVNRDGDRLVYIRQSAPGIGAVNAAFSMPEIDDLRSAATTVGAFGDSSTFDFTLVGLGEPRVVVAAIVSGSYFDVMGLRPILGRLLDTRDEGPDAAGTVVLTYRFWAESLGRNETVVGKSVRLGSRTATIVGVLEPSVPYPAETDMIVNVVTSPHHLGATMKKERTHRMTELFGRLAPGATVEAARAELIDLHTAMMRQHPEAYSAAANMQLSVTLLRDQITSPARAILLILLAAAGVVFAIACSNVANLILARTVRRESELAVRAALGASAGALRRTLLGESLVLCGAGALLGVLLARPFVAIVSAYAARFSVRALDVTVDGSVLWVGAGLAMAAAVALAYVPRLPASYAGSGFGVAGCGVRITRGTNRRLQGFAVAQIALSFVLLAGAGVILSALVTLQTANTGYDVRRVLAFDVPVPLESGVKSIEFFREAARRIEKLDGVERVAVGNFVPWRDAGSLLRALPFSADGYVKADDEADPHARLRSITPGFFAALGIRILAGRDFGDGDGRGGEPVSIVSESVARRVFPDGEALGRHVWWTDPMIGKLQPRRIVGVVADADDENVAPRTALTIYHPYAQLPYADRLFVRAAGDPYALVAPVTRIVRDLSPDQPVDRAATLGDVRAQALAPDRLNAFVLSGFAGVALLIAVVGVAGVLAFTVSARTRELGVRLAMGSTPRHLLLRVLTQGASIAAIGIAVGAAGAYVFGRLAAGYFDNAHAPGWLPMLAAATVLATAAILASLMPAARASRVNVLEALRSE